MSVKNWPLAEKPRERLFQYGAETLSDAELIALLLRNGLPGRDAVALSRELLHNFGSLRGLLSLEWKTLKKVKGLGPAKIASLLAITEIMRRFLREKMIGRSYIREPQSILEYLAADLRDRKIEFFKVLFLNKANCVLSDETLFTGTVDQTAVHPRELVKAALEKDASAVILVHNHPSGRPEPSREDKELTAKLEMLCREMSIKVLDHIIIAGNQIFSFREHGLL